MAKRLEITTVLTLVFGGVFATVVAFALQEYGPGIFRPTTPNNVTAHARVENDRITVFVRNDSAKTVDFLRAELTIEWENADRSLGAFPEISHVYDLTDGVTSQVLFSANQISISARLTQVVRPGARDQFAFRVENLVGSEVELVVGELLDHRNRSFPIEFSQ